jgi:hypothetical protein
MKQQKPLDVSCSKPPQQRQHEVRASLWICHKTRNRPHDRDKGASTIACRHRQKHQRQEQVVSAIIDGLAFAVMPQGRQQEGKYYKPNAGP